MSLKWQHSFNLGFAEIDNQHQHFIDALNQYLSHLGDTKHADENMQFELKQLHQYIHEHFATEEKYFTAFNYEDADKHIATHRQFSARLAELEQAITPNNLEASFVLADFIVEWLMNHLNKMDRKYVECFKSHGLK